MTIVQLIRNDVWDKLDVSSPRFPYLFTPYAVSNELKRRLEQDVKGEVLGQVVAIEDAVRRHLNPRGDWVWL